MLDKIVLITCVQVLLLGLINNMGLHGFGLEALLPIVGGIITYYLSDKKDDKK